MTSQIHKFFLGILFIFCVLIIVHMCQPRCEYAPSPEKVLTEEGLWPLITACWKLKLVDHKLKSAWATR